VLLALFAVATATVAADLNVAYAGTIILTSQYNPVNIDSGDKLKKLFEGLTGCPNYALINSYDNQWWVFYAGSCYDTMVFRFNKPGGYTSGSCRWRVGGTGNAVKLYRWDNSIERFRKIDENAGGDPPNVEYVNIPSSWFSPESQLILMAVVNIYPTWEHYMKCDVMDIQY
jgi:hypothetical protein